MERPVDEVPVEAMARFTAAEARLYPMALTDPAGYELVDLARRARRRGAASQQCATSRRCWGDDRS